MKLLCRILKHKWKLLGCIDDIGFTRCDKCGLVCQEDSLPEHTIYVCLRCGVKEKRNV
jgi:hypothetical protein